MKGSDLSYMRADSLLRRFRATRIWDQRDDAYYAFWDDAGTYEYLWEEDARSFNAKLPLVKEFGLRGYSVWVLGAEDPAIWATLPRARGR